MPVCQVFFYLLNDKKTVSLTLCIMITAHHARQTGLCRSMELAVKCGSRSAGIIVSCNCSTTPDQFVFQQQSELFVKLNANYAVSGVRLFFQLSRFEKSDKK